ncbi:YecA family protein, partial [Pseudomonas syringae pv. tagetis]
VSCVVELGVVVVVWVLRGWWLGFMVGVLLGVIVWFVSAEVEVSVMLLPIMFGSGLADLQQEFAEIGLYAILFYEILVQFPESLTALYLL